MEIVVVNGAAGCGKNTFTDFCSEFCSATEDTSMVDCAKHIALHAGWDMTKTPKNRWFLSSLKDLIDEWDDCSYKYVQQYIERCEMLYHETIKNDMIVFVMARQKEDIERLKSDYDATSVFVSRKEAEEVAPSNHADAEIYNITYDYYINNNGTLEDLKEESRKFVEWLMKGRNKCLE